MRTAGTGTPFGQSQSPSEKSAMRGGILAMKEEDACNEEDYSQ